MHLTIIFPTLFSVLVLFPVKICRGFTTSRGYSGKVLSSRRPNIDNIIQTLSINQPSIGAGYPPMNRSLQTRSTTTLFERSSKNDNEPQEDVLASVDSGPLLADIMAIAIACQLMGLLDVLGDSSFWANGGWFQPIPAAPSTLPVLIQRVSLNCVLFFVASLSLNAYNDKSASSPQQIMLSALQRSGVYAALRIATEALLSLMLVPENPALSMDLIQVLRECYVVALSTTAARYVFYNLFSR